MAIKRVVVPEKRTKWVCELSEDDFSAVTCGSLCVHQERFKKVEEALPVLCDQVSINDINDVCTEKMYATMFEDRIRQSAVIIDSNNKKHNIFIGIPIKEGQNLVDCIKSAMNIDQVRNFGVYQFDNQIEFFERSALKLRENNIEY